MTTKQILINRIRTADELCGENLKVDFNNKNQAIKDISLISMDEISLILLLEIVIVAKTFYNKH